MDIANISTHGLPRIIVLGGPTAVGKTRFSLALAEAFGAEIVNYDSVQLYRHLDIGTAKPSAEERARVPHHLFDVLDPDQESNVADYMAMAHATIAEIVGRGKVPLLVGGTGMYARILVHGIFEAPPADPEIRARHRELVDAHGEAHLHAMLAEVDPELAQKFHENDVLRVSRGLEIYEQTGKALSVHQREHRFREPNYDALKIGLLRPREELYDRINQRVDQMMAQGLLDEYKELISRGYDRRLKPLQSLGYRQMQQHLFEDVPLDEAVEDMKVSTRRYAKQQISWFRKEPRLHWALAPILEQGAQQDEWRLPATVRDDIEAFIAGAPTDQLDLSWAQLDSHNVER
ncbi:tRNA (adenosine(37)-N6)-dimethylallyltransferase MiaA [Bradymonas sediminis]|uniref:tRNA dimethylallyltransferase n=1 Tax=Bradymonas sediminis TaxID=1548548 RepID=A0A2Z4FG89_9DELT|nr:tRNA (adenosine(37)-N6)-dimethylallyltransferase MiaA [Bradymonas sediminis]AWV87937.1 tRNA (adenosine(37)-N6)-dimethylallyltransferase MiaA [Bradymonas sediminis]TDP62955.1 tRNA dimethylallyltransferase [Bradymonas sediminis]